MNYKEIKTYPEMNEKIVGILTLFSTGKVSHNLYAAKRIEELEAEVKYLKIKLENSNNPF